MTPQSKNKNTVLVLDLDDTLYKEADYVLSGINHIAELLKKTTQQDIKEKLFSFHQNNPKDDFLELACQLTALPTSSKESLLWAYRTHYPSISLDDETKQWLKWCKKEYHALVILTDGRAITQRLKISALGLSDIPAYISEEWNSEKPNPKRFLAIQEKWGDKNYIYIGDNIKKDFIAPQKLNWITIGLKNDGHNIHSQDNTSATYQPEYWVNCLTETNSLINQIMP